MIQVTHRELMPGVRLTAVHTDKFKSNVLSLSLLAPLAAETASANALLPCVLRRGTARHPDMEALSAALDDLYGGSIEPSVRKKGETQAVGFVASFLDDAYAPGETHILEDAAGLLGDLLLRPATESGGFRRDYVEGERANLIDRIQAQINEKRAYSLLRLTQEMCAGEPFGVDKLGDAARAAALTPEGLWERYQALLSQAPIELYYCGSAPADRVAEALTSALAGLPRTGTPERPGCGVRAEVSHEAPRLVTESLDVTQGKLALGFRTGGSCVWTEDFPALMVFNAVYGGTPTSKLFLNVREKLSLCYFASSILEKCKGLLMVSSGIEFQNYQKAYDEILSQMEAVQRGALEDWELEGARSTLLNAYASMGDSQGKLENFYLGQAATGQEDTPELLAEQVRQVTAERIFDAMQTASLDTVYFLKGKEAAE